MTANDAFILYKRIDDEIQAQEIPPQRYLSYELKDERKLKLFQELVDAKIDLHKFFLANCILNKQFYIDFYGYNRDKCMTLYYSWDEFLVKKRDEYFRRIITEVKKGVKIDLNDRDAFLDMLPITDYLLFSVLYPEDFELLVSLECDWVKFNMPGYSCSMDYIRRVIKGNLALKHMKSFDKLREKVLKVLNK